MKMKKSVYLLVVVLSVLLLCGCAAKKTDAIVSQLRTDVLEGKTGDCVFTAYLEEREIPLIADGIAGDKTPAVIVKISDSSAFYGAYTVTVTVSGKEYSAAPELKADTLMKATVILDEPCRQKEITVTLKGEKEVSATLVSVLPEDTCGYEKALDTAKTALGDKIIYKGGKAEGEIFIRVLYENGAAYWYVGYVNGDTVNSVLIGADGETVVAEKDFANDNK